MIIIIFRLLFALIIFINGTIANIFMCIINYKLYNSSYYTMDFTDENEHIKYYFQNPFYWALKLKKKSTSQSNLYDDLTRK